MATWYGAKVEGAEPQATWYGITVGKQPTASEEGAPRQAGAKEVPQVGPQRPPEPQATWYGITVTVGKQPTASEEGAPRQAGAWYKEVPQVGPQRPPSPDAHAAVARAADGTRLTPKTAWYGHSLKGAISGKEADIQRRARAPRQPEAVRRARKPQSAAAALRASRADPLAGAYSTLRRTVRATRGEGGEEERRHVRVIMAGMSLEEQQRAARDRVLVGRVSVITQYEVYCASKARPGGVYPITEAMACGFLTWSVFKEGRPVRSHALAHYLSNLRTAAQEMGQWAVGTKALSAVGPVGCGCGPMPEMSASNLAGRPSAVTFPSPRPAASQRAGPWA